MRRRVLSLVDALEVSRAQGLCSLFG